MRYFLFCTALVAAGQSKPNFSGNWILNLQASDLSAPNINKPDKITIAIQQKGDHFKYRWDRYGNGKKAGYDVEVSVGGGPHVSDEAGIISMEWKGSTLMVNTLYNPGQDRESNTAETWTLSEDGKRLTDDVVVHPPQNRAPVHLVRVFDKQ